MVGLVLSSVSLIGSGCSVGGPPRIYPPSISPAAAGRGAMEQYDTNKDGLVNGDELENAPSLKAAIKQLDTNKDGGVSADEIADRIRAWQASKVGRMSAGCVVTLRGRPLSDARVTFEPEKFLGNEIEPCSGITDESGIASLSVKQKKKGDPPGAACGLYLVRISKRQDGKEIVPARYNTETILGQEVALDAAGMQTGLVRFELTGP